MSEVKLPQDFSEYWYIKYNPDVAKAVNEGIVPSGAEHYLYNGHKENRKYSEPSVTENSIQTLASRKDGLDPLPIHLSGRVYEVQQEELTYTL